MNCIGPIRGPEISRYEGQIESVAETQENEAVPGHSEIEFDEVFQVVEENQKSSAQELVGCLGEVFRRAGYGAAGVLISLLSFTVGLPFTIAAVIIAKTNTSTESGKSNQILKSIGAVCAFPMRLAAACLDKAFGGIV